MGYDLKVHKVLRAASHSEVSNTEAFLNASLCCGCGVCSVIACQQMLDPQAIAMEVKAELGRQGFRRQNGRQIDSVSPYRSGRLLPSKVLAERLGLKRFMGKTVVRDMRRFDPEYVYIPMSQHVGAPAKPLVKVGDKVKRGDLIAKTPENMLGTCMHASIGGQVTEVTDSRVVIKK